MHDVYLLDTNIISEFSKPVPNQVLMHNVLIRENLCAISSISWQETIQGYERMPEGKRKEKLISYIEKIRETFPIIPYDEFAAKICGELRAKCEGIGRTAPLCDSQIAATAIANGMVLITHNTEDFANLRSVSILKTEDWWV